MSAADAAAALLWLSLTAYAVLAGADFGGGVWDIFASGPRKQAQRRAVARAMGPVWEANHVWLIFMITGLFTTFPVAFSPVTIALMGIVLRGAAFAFRAHGREAVGPTSPWGIVFGGSSIVTPFFLGTAAAAVATGAIRITDGKVVSGFGDGWTTAFAVVIGLLAVALCAYLAAAYLMVETEDDPALQAYRTDHIANAQRVCPQPNGDLICDQKGYWTMLTMGPATLGGDGRRGDPPTACDLPGAALGPSAWIVRLAGRGLARAS